MTLRTKRKLTLIRAKPLPSNKPDAREAEDDILQLTHTPENNTQGLGEQMHN